jgi:hypothetical protein
MTPPLHPLLIDCFHQPFIRIMASPSDYSSVDNDRFRARTQHIMQEPPSEPEIREGAESDFAGFGGQFVDRRSSYPHQIEISEGEETVRQARSTSQAELFLSPSPGAVDRPSLGSPPTTPTPNRYQDARLVQPSDVPLTHEMIRRGRGRRRRSFGTLLSLSFRRRDPLLLLLPLTVVYRHHETGVSEINWTNLNFLEPLSLLYTKCSRSTRTLPYLWTDTEALEPVNKTVLAKRPTRRQHA